MQMRVAAPPGCSPEELGAKHPNGLNDGVWSIEHRAIRHRGGPLRRGRRAAVGPRWLESQARPALQAAILDLQNRRNAFDNPPPLSGLNNPSFEAPLRGALIPGWTVNVADGQAAIVTNDAYSGRQALRFTGKYGPAVSLRSDPLPAIETGRLAVSLWMKVPAGGVQPRLRLILEGLYDGRPFYRTAPLGDWPGAVLIPEVWKQFIFSVDDLPPDRVTQPAFGSSCKGPAKSLSTMCSYSTSCSTTPRKSI